MAVVMQYVIGGLTAVCTSLVVVLLIWQGLSRRFFFIRGMSTPCCDVTDLLAWLIDASQALMGAAILVLVVSDDIICAVAGFLAMFGGAQTLCLLATRSVVMATSHVTPKNRCDAGSKRNEKRCVADGRSIALLITEVSVVGILCALPLSQLPIATTSHHNQTADHLVCLPLSMGSHNTTAWRYSCFLLVAVGWLPLLVTAAMDIFHCSCWTHEPLALRSRDNRCLSDRRQDCTHGSVWLLFFSALRLLFWTVVIILLSIEVLAVPNASRRETVELLLAIFVDIAMLIHIAHTVLYVHHIHISQTPVHEQYSHQLPTRLTSVTRADQQSVRVSLYQVIGAQIND